MSDASELVAEYRESVQRAAFAASMLIAIDFDKLIRDIDHADAVGPIVDPTLYRDKSKAMQEDRALLVAAKNFLTVAMKGKVPT